MQCKVSQYPEILSFW